MELGATRPPSGGVERLQRLAEDLQGLAQSLREEWLRTDEARQALAQVLAERQDQRDVAQRRLADAEARLAELEAQRELLKVGIPRDFIARFDTIFNARGGVAVARIVSNACGACHVRLRPQIINLVRRGEDLSFCESCRRILYFADSEGEPGGAGAPAPGAPADAAGKQPGQGLTPAGA